MGASESRAREENGETRESSDTPLANESSGTALGAGAIAGAVLWALGAGVVSLMGDSSKSSEEKTMKAPGRDMRMPRRQFEESPVTYFRDLRNDSSKSGKEKTMKAPGRDMRIPRRQFEKSPVTYFRNLRQDSSKSGKENSMKAPGRDMRIPGVPSRRAPAPTSKTRGATSGRSSR